MNLVELKKYDVFTLDVMYLLEVANRPQFRIVKVYKKKFYPRRKIKWLKFWKWHEYFKEYTLIDVEFLGDGSDGKLYQYK